MVGFKLVEGYYTTAAAVSHFIPMLLTDQPHLVLSTKQDLLFVLEISDIQNEQLDVKYENFLPAFKKRNGEDGRNYINIWERGSRIIGVLHGDESAVILQTTRGNLECI